MSGEHSPLFVGADTAKKSTVVFNSDSDTDSITTDSTAQSDCRDEYEVERILMEVPDEENCYLVKWEGYKLFRSTWEPPESLVGGEILAEWERRKKRIEAGEEEPFNYDDFVRAYSEAEAEKKAKRMRRNAKRQKRGLPIHTYSSEDGNEDGEDGEAEDESSDDLNVGVTARSSKRPASPKVSPKATKRVKQPDKAKKGVAKVIRKRVVSATSSSDDGSSSDVDQSSSTDSLQEELLAQTKRPSRRSKDAANVRSETAARNAISTSSPSKSTSTAPGKSVTTKTKADVTKAPHKAPHKAGPSGAGRKSAPGPAAGSGGVLRDPLANWDAPKQRKERPRVSGATPKDSFEPKFKNLSALGRFQKYGRENERPPDFNALTVVDLASGKTIPPKATVPRPGPVQTASAKTLPSAYSRRTPPPQERKRSATPPSPGRAPAVPTSLVATENVGKPTKPICRRWLTSGCQKSAENCDYVHPLSRFRVNVVPDKKLITCYFWLAHGGCTHGDRCLFTHADTGIYSTAPGSTGGFFGVKLPPIDATPPQPSPPPPPPPGPTTSLPGTPQPQPIATVAAKTNTHHPGHPACREWLEGHCTKPATACSWAHALPTEPYQGITENLPKRQVFCYYKASKGLCLQGDSCAFSHVDTGVQAGPPGGGFAARTNILPSQASQNNSIVAPQAARTNSSVSKAEAIARGLSLRDVTCFFWRTKGGHCGKADACEYAHHHTGIWAAPPPGHSEAKSHARSVENANMLPVAASRRPSFTAHTTAPDLASNGADVDMSMELVESLVHVQAAPMAPPVREITSRRMSASTSTESLSPIVSILYSGDQSPTQVQVKLGLSELQIWSKLAGADPQLTIDRAVLASDFRNIVWDDQLRDTECTVGSVTVPDSATGQSLVDLCKQHTIGLIAIQTGKKAKMLIYPPSDDAWKFLDTGNGMDWKSDAALRFRLFSDIPGIGDLPTSKPLQTCSSSQPIIIVGEQLAKLNCARLVPVKDHLNQGHRAVFLMFPATHHAELEFYAKFFGAQKYHVYHSGVAGAWQFFRQCDHRKVLMVHPDVPLWQIPGLKQLLKTGMAVFSVGYNRLESMDDQTFSCERLFPFANAVLVTDDVFVYHADKAFEILDGFIRYNKDRPENKLVTRPGIKAWLLRLAEDSISAGHGNKHLRLYDAICRLCPPEDEDAEDPPNPDPDKNLVSLSTDLFPNYDTLWQNDESAATNFLVEWFAGWTIENVATMRKSYVLYEPKSGFPGMLDSAGRWVTNEDPFGWAQKYQHIDFRKAEDVFQKKGGERMVSAVR